MLNLELKTRLPQEEVIKRLKRFFAGEELGLDLKEETARCLTFEGGGGFVTATLCSEEGKTRVDLVTREWEYQVRQFASKIG
jgi:hypothetical protein